MNTVNRKCAVKSDVPYNGLLRAAAILMAMNIGSASLRAACHLDPSATTPPGGVGLHLNAGNLLFDVVYCT